MRRPAVVGWTIGRPSRSGKQNCLRSAPRRPSSPRTTSCVSTSRTELAGQVRTPDGTLVLGPTPAAWKGQNKARRQDRRWATSWSPQQIANRAAASHGLEAMLVPAGQPASGELPSGSAEACAPAVTGVPVTAEQRCEIWQFIWPYGRVTRPAEFTCGRLRGASIVARPGIATAHRGMTGRAVAQSFPRSARPPRLAYGARV